MKAKYGALPTQKDLLSKRMKVCVSTVPLHHASAPRCYTLPLAHTLITSPTFTRMQGPAEKKHFDSADWAQELDSAEALPLTTTPPELAAS